MKKLILFITILSVGVIHAQRVECVGDEEAGQGIAGAFPCANFDLLSVIPITDFEAVFNEELQETTISDSWGWTHEASGREFAIISYTEGFAYVEVTDPINPVITAVVPIAPNADVQRLWRDVKVYKDHAYMVGEDTGQGMKIFNMNRLLDVENPPQVLQEDVFFEGFGQSHNIAINEETGYAYPIGARDFFGGGPIFINIQDPLNPIMEGGYDATEDGANAYSHDAQIVIYDGPDPDYQGREIYMGSNEDHLVIADITEKDNPQFISNLSYTAASYVHQGWFTKDKRYFVMGDELDEVTNGLPTRLIVYNVEDLDNPSIHFIYQGVTFATDHNIYIIEDTLYLANYVDGLRVLDISDIDNMNFEEIGFFDTVPGAAAALGGVWNAYPYFPSGNIIMSDLEAGLFVVGPSNVLAADDNNVADFSLFPNPSSGRVVTLAADNMTIQSIKVTSVIGEQVYYEEGISVESHTLDTSNYSTGVYMVTINNQLSKKLIVK